MGGGGCLFICFAVVEGCFVFVFDRFCCFVFVLGCRCFLLLFLFFFFSFAFFSSSFFFLLALFCCVTGVDYDINFKM